MCIIVDANVAHELANRTPDSLPVLAWLKKDRSGLVIGGKLLDELRRTRLAGILLELNRTGRLHHIEEGEVKRKQDELLRTGSVQSNDCHVVALALVSGCKLVYTRDKILHADLKVCCAGKHRIAIYKSATHSKLLKDCRCSSQG